MQDLSNYYQFSRNEWQDFHGEHHNQAITDAELRKIKSLDDEISIDDVKVIYAPIRHLLHVYLKNYRKLVKLKNEFIEVDNKKVPFIIGVSGSVAVGKSTTARLLKIMLERAYPQYNVGQMTTDGFLYPSKVLKEKGLMDKKGFPETYDMPKLIQFLSDVKTKTGPIKYPLYSHNIYDIIPDQYEEVNNPDILIVEGINVLQLPQNTNIYVSDFFDFSIFIDAHANDIEKWFLNRFSKLLDMAKDDPDSYYYQFTQIPRQKAIDMAKDVWNEINYPNLQDYIEPTRNRANIILHKSTEHKIDTVFLRKY
ncbi:type I pantothenate kinase [Companilactobacillus sp.]|jgi:type I pantothenate kinase|uniref:type I pantothenate kinase n=1 Tax=Companilactobacillus sp. TaxID=2767905 RepID=UPI0025BE8C65|nr:type I pantothenate kinase [Companilactobacillus sp.]MCH4009637.1 type I pantothenate kinase [Companilactobacillus sp.]MCH4052687.1 type I pantothenate kinase [Companilactobacillus sp.]MCH4077579.1 type I pantothenate kinase [Companilactobacillus sp.]MCH4126155.1 type I pantothenate kinase [Companilactobacillus sp.]MCI1311863.1 type I pantothenate kinase [Companilactobacillus sp.]